MANKKKQKSSGESVEQNVSKEPVKQAAQNPRQNPSQNAPQKEVKKAAQNPPQNQTKKAKKQAAQNPRQNPSQNASQKEVKKAAQNPPQNQTKKAKKQAAQSQRQNPSQNAPKKEVKKTAQNPPKKVEEKPTLNPPQNELGKSPQGCVANPKAKVEHEPVKLQKQNCPYGKDFERHPNSLANMKPSDKWTVFIDETGCHDKHLSGDSSAGLRVAALFVPQRTNLPPLDKEWHAAGRTPEEIQKVVGRVLGKDCGILGIHVNVLERIKGDPWIPAIKLILEMGLRLIPKKGPTKFAVKAEERYEFKPEDNNIWKYLSGDVEMDYANAYPGQSENVKIEGRFIKKGDDPCHGYADAIAYLWGSERKEIKDLLQSSSLLGSCFYSANIQTLRDSLDHLRNEKTISPPDWTALLNAEVPNENNSYDTLPHSLLRELGQKVQKQPELWEKFFAYFSEMVNSKTVRLETLDLQLKWLESFEPSALPPRTRLRFLTSKLAVNNRHGRMFGDFEYEEEFHSLANVLYEEDARLVCDAVVTRATAYVNALDFKKLGELFKRRWNAETIAKSPEIPGLKLAGRLFSTYGQYKCLIGENDEGVSYFKKAIKLFERLSDPSESEIEISHTRERLMIALMDAEKDSEFEQQFNKYFAKNYLDRTEDLNSNLSLSDVAKILSESGDDCSVYAHWLFLRFLAVSKTVKARKAKEVYFDASGKWKSGSNHPWELIEFYRGVLGAKDESFNRLNLARKAIEPDRKSDGAFRLLDCVFLGSMLYYREKDDCLVQGYAKQMEAARKIKKIGDDRLRILEAQMERLTRLEPLEFAKKLLPFNFR